MDPLPYYKWHWRDWRANRRVQRMPWQAKGLYRELLDEFWAEGSLPVSHEELADICGCSRDEFEAWWPHISGSWEEREGRLYNAKMDQQRTDKDRERVAKSEAGRTGGLKSNSQTRAQENQSHAEQEQASAKQVLASAEEMQAQPDIAEQSRAEHKQEHSPRGKREGDPRSSEFKSSCEAYFKHKGLPMTWDASEAKQLKNLLAANPSLSIEQFQGILRNRSRSGVNHAERPRSWLSRATEYLAGPLDKYGKPMEVDGGNRGTHQGNQSRGVSRYEQQLEELAKAGVTIPSGRTEAGPEQDVPIAGGSHGFGSPGVVLEGIR